MRKSISKINGFNELQSFLCQLERSKEPCLNQRNFYPEDSNCDYPHVIYKSANITLENTNFFIHNIARFVYDISLRFKTMQSISLIGSKIIFQFNVDDEKSVMLDIRVEDTNNGCIFKLIETIDHYYYDQLFFETRDFFNYNIDYIETEMEEKIMNQKTPENNPKDLSTLKFVETPECEEFSQKFGYENIKSIKMDEGVLKIIFYDEQPVKTITQASEVIWLAVKFNIFN